MACQKSSSQGPRTVELPSRHDTRAAAVIVAAVVADAEAARGGWGIEAAIK